MVITYIPSLLEFEQFPPDEVTMKIYYPFQKYSKTNSNIWKILALQDSAKQ